MVESVPLLSLFSILHCNIRSLSKNLNLLEELLCSLDSKQDILGITETKLGENSISNVIIKGYNFLHTDSPTNAGGAALYIANNLRACLHGGGGPQVGEVTRLGGVTRLST